MEQIINKVMEILKMSFLKKKKNEKREEKISEEEDLEKTEKDEDGEKGEGKKATEEDVEEILFDGNSTKKNKKKKNNNVKLFVGLVLVAGGIAFFISNKNVSSNNVPSKNKVITDVSQTKTTKTIDKKIVQKKEKEEGVKVKPNLSKFLENGKDNVKADNQKIVKKRENKGVKEAKKTNRNVQNLKREMTDKEFKDNVKRYFASKFKNLTIEIGENEIYLYDKILGIRYYDKSMLDDFKKGRIIIDGVKIDCSTNDVRKIIFTVRIAYVNKYLHKNFVFKKIKKRFNQFKVYFFEDGMNIDGIDYIIGQSIIDGLKIEDIIPVSENESIFVFRCKDKTMKIKTRIK